VSFNQEKIYTFDESLSAGFEDDVVVVPNIPMLVGDSREIVGVIAARNGVSKRWNVCTVLNCQNVKQILQDLIILSALQGPRIEQLLKR
jgi:hypothetical protein